MKHRWHKSEYIDLRSFRVGNLSLSPHCKLLSYSLLSVTGGEKKEKRSGEEKWIGGAACLVRPVLTCR